jgi:hypothetical protein
MVAAKFAAMVRAEAAERERAGKKPSGDMTGGSGEKGETAVILGNRFGIGETTVRKAVRVRKVGKFPTFRRDSSPLLGTTLE